MYKFFERMFSPPNHYIVLEDKLIKSEKIVESKMNTQSEIQNGIVWQPVRKCFYCETRDNLVLCLKCPNLPMCFEHITKYHQVCPRSIKASIPNI